MKEKIRTVIFLLSIVTCTQIDAQKIVPRPAECGTTRGCFSDCEGGSTCGFVVLWNVDGTNAVYTMRTSLLTTTAWMALGFSNDTTMANDDIILFAPYSNGTYGGFSGHTPLHSRPTLYTDTELTLTASSNQNGILSCTIQRPINASANGRVNANTPWILLFAVGNTTFSTTGDPSISYHRSNRFWSSGEVSIANISNVGAVSVHPTTPAPTAGPQPAGCGVSMGCFSDCQGSTCNFVVSWAVSGTTVTYNLTSAIFPTGGTWMAIGFSNNTEMDNDDVLGCASDASGIVKFSGINGNEAPPKQYADAEVILTSSSVQNGALMCSIQRPISASTTTGRVNADTAWTLLFAKGPATIDATSRVVSIFYHEGNRYWSTQQARATTFIDSGALKEKTNIVPRPAECGSTRGCFSDCEGGSTCGFVVLWNVVGTNAVYTMTTSLLKAATWMALGFSNDTTMEDDDVIWCAPNSNGRYIGFSGHTPRHRRPIPYNDTELTLTASSNQNGILSCTIQRPISESPNGRVNANTPWILLFAVGDTQFTAAGEANISYHGRINRFWSSAEVKITNTSDVGAESVHPVTPSPTTGPQPAGCGTSMGCFSDCQGSTCNFVVSWAVSGTTVTYNLTSAIFPTGGTWMAIGFSNNTEMDNDDVLGCASDASGIVKFSGINGIEATPEQYADADVILTSSSVQNGALMCSIQRPISASTTGRVNADTAWTLLFAKGPATIDATSRAVSIFYHEGNRYWSTQQARATTFIDSGALKEKTSIVPRPAECGTTRGCFSDCEGGSACGFVVLWNVVGANAVYTMTTSLLKAATWMALGFSNDTTMEDDDVIWCAPNSNGRYIGFSGHTPRHRRPIPYNDTELTLTASSNQNGILSCTIQRPISESPNGRVNANTPWILLFAVGDTQFTAAGEANISYHGRINRFWSSAEVKITNTSDVGAESVHPVTPSPTTGPQPAGCGTSMGCFSDCQGSTCNFVVSWAVSGTTVTYNLTSAIFPTGGTWMAIGFSNNTEMDNDDVLGCASDASGIVKFSGINGIEATPEQYADADVILTSSSVQNGALMCSIQRPISASTTGRVNADTAWTLLFAKGPATIDATSRAVSIFYHEGNRYWSTQQARATTFIDSGALKEKTSIVPRPAECGTTRGCFSDCEGGSACGFVVLWNVVGANAVYTMTTSLLKAATWMALGFSNDTTMEDDDVIWCAPNSNGRYIGFSGHTPRHRRPIPYNDTELTLTTSSNQNGILSCTIQRPINESPNGRVNANTPWILLFAVGDTQFTAAGEPNISYHGRINRFWSSAEVKITNTSGVGAESVHPVTPSPTTGAIEKPKECGTSVGCFSSCQASGCNFVVSWTSDGVNAFYSFITNLQGSSGTWIAIGFSNDAKMGDDDVLGCATDASNAVSSFTAHNNVQSPPAYRTDDEVKLTNGSVVNNVLACTVQRPIAGTTNGRRDVNQTWIYLVAKGEAGLSGGKVQIKNHQSNRFILNQQVSVNDKLDVGASTLDFPLIKAHGSLMIVAWIFLASIGIVLARYYKPVWTGLLCSEKVWFQVHRICMILVFCTTAAGFIIIFIQVDGYSEINEEREFLVGHPIIGIIVMILTVINPVMALFRPHPGTPRRPIFNWAHWFVGTAAHILGVVNIFFGVLLTKSDVPYYLVYILGAYVAWQIFVELLLEILTFFGRKMERSEAYEMDADSGAKKSVAVESSCTVIIKRVILIVHCIIVASFAAALIGLLATGKAELEDE